MDDDPHAVILPEDVAPTWPQAMCSLGLFAMQPLRWYLKTARRHDVTSAKASSPRAGKLFQERGNLKRYSGVSF